ncbi:MAG: endonuclease [Bacteroidales bacterium]|jgi:endonuclease I|nr:endonuclease [Bacteroidales bacterium]
MKHLICILFSFFFIFFQAFGEIPEGYYDNAEGKSGAELKTCLYNIIKGHTSLGYAGLWAAYATTDRRADGKIWDMYSTCTFTYSNDQCGNYSNICDCYNREHSFPKSWFGGSESSAQGNDAFHIYPTDGKVNGERGNYPFGEVGSTDNSVVNTNLYALGKRGAARAGLGYSGKVFEPVDEYKGDFARTYFYMATRYENVFASWYSYSEAQAMLAGNAYPGYKQWTIDMLLEWHHNDPVSQKEIDRNNAVYALQHNRNPFIDHPEYAVCIWQAANCEASNIIENNEDDIIFYPNPVSTELNVQCAMCNVQCVEIFDITGKLHSTLHFDFSTKKIDVVDLPAGTYFIKIGEKTGKFVKE